MQSIYSMFDLFDQIFHDNFLKDFSTETCYPSFPPYDLYINEESKDLTFEFAIAGYNKDNINISFEDDMMIISVNKIDENLSSKKGERKRKGIKKSAFSAKYAIPQSKYNFDKAKADYKDGILEVFIPAKEEAKPKTLLIN